MTADSPGEKERVEFLTKCDPFTTLPPTIIQQLAGCIREATFATGEYLMHQGDPADSLMVILEGAVEVSAVDPEGRRRVLNEVGPRGIVGEMALLTQTPRTASVQAISPVTLWQLVAEDFHTLARRHPLLSVVLTKLLDRRLGQDSVDALGGKDLHGYRIFRCIGTGGMSVVYEACEVSTGRPVALKMLSHHLTYDIESAGRFEREAKLASSLDHPNILRVYELFPAFQTFFIAMEYCDGSNLHQISRRFGALPEDQVRRIIGQLAKALQHAHEHGVIHRDIKPGNVMLNTQGMIKLTDFGIASATKVDANLTKTGFLVGTPRYMAPQQIEGEDANPSFDLYAMGCIALELLTGKPVFAEREVMKLLLRKATWKIPPRDTFEVRSRSPCTSSWSNVWTPRPRSAWKSTWRTPPAGPEEPIPASCADSSQRQKTAATTPRTRRGNRTAGSCSSEPVARPKEQVLQAHRANRHRKVNRREGDRSRGAVPQSRSTARSRVRQGGQNPASLLSHLESSRVSL